MRYCSRHSRAASDLEAFLLIGTLLWLTLAFVRWLIQHPRMIPLVALALFLMARAH